MARQELKKLIPQRTASVQPVQAEDAPPSAEEAESIEAPQAVQEPPAATAPAKASDAASGRPRRIPARNGAHRGRR